MRNAPINVDMEKEIIHEVINEEVIIKKKDHIFSMYKR
jgi:hypothetical protein